MINVIATTIEALWPDNLERS